jgi:outer membrane murein-binding lipoprotein Lpp
MTPNEFEKIKERMTSLEVTRAKIVAVFAVFGIGVPAAIAFVWLHFQKAQSEINAYRSEITSLQSDVRALHNPVSQAKTAIKIAGDSAAKQVQESAAEAVRRELARAHLAHGIHSKDVYVCFPAQPDCPAGALRLAPGQNDFSIVTLDPSSPGKIKNAWAGTVSGSAAAMDLLDNLSMEPDGRSVRFRTLFGGQGTAVGAVALRVWYDVIP